MILVSALEIAGHVRDLVIAYTIALPLGSDRERSERSAGIRTFPLVAMASCGFVLIALRAVGEGAQQARIIEGLITGMGFIGGGAILKRASETRGTATAASLWATGAIGAAVGYGLYDIGVVLSVATFATLRWNRGFKRIDEKSSDVA